MNDRNLLIFLVVLMTVLASYLTGYKLGSEQSTAIWEATFSEVTCYPNE